MEKKTDEKRCTDLVNRADRLGSRPPLVDYVIWKADVYSYVSTAMEELTVENLSKLLEIDDNFWRGETTPPTRNFAVARDLVRKILKDWCGKKEEKKKHTRAKPKK